MKEHNKMYKAGKKWVVALIATAALTGVMAVAGHADTVDSSQAVTTTAAQYAATNDTVTPNQNADTNAAVNNGHLDGVNSDNQGNIVFTGWHASNKYQAGTEHYIIALDANNNHELYRTKAAVVNRPDVQAVYPQAAISGDSGFRAVIPAAKLAPAAAYRLVSRYTTQANGEPSGNNDFYYPVVTSKAGCLDSLKINGNKITASGWHADDQSVIKPTHFIILFDQTKNREVTRKIVTNMKSSDVANVNRQIVNAGQSRFSVDFDITPELVGDQLTVISRYSDSKDIRNYGNYSDYWFNKHVQLNNNQAGCLDQFKLVGQKVYVAGWHAADASALMSNHLLILFDKTDNREVARKKVATTASIDVAQHGFGNIANADHARFATSFNVAVVPGHQLALISRYSNSDNGEGNHVDNWFNNTVSVANQSASWIDTLTCNDQTGDLHVAGWHATDAAMAYPHHFIIVFDATTNREVARKEVTNVASPDIANVHGDILNAGQARFSADFKLDPQVHTYKIVSRYSDSSDGEGHYSQEWMTNKVANPLLLDGDYLYDIHWNAHKLPNTAEGIAQLIADCSRMRGGNDLSKVKLAATYVSAFCDRDRYTMSGPYYSKPYGVFIAREFSCAGSTRALGLVLNDLGYSYTHVNENQYTHQWCKLMMDGQLGWADGQIGEADYGHHPAEF